MQMADNEQQVLLDILTLINTSSLAFGTDDDVLALLPLEAELLLGTESLLTATTDERELDTQPTGKKKKKVYVRRDPRKEIAQLQDEAALLQERLALLRRRQRCAVQQALPNQHRLAMIPSYDDQGVERQQAPAVSHWIDKALVEFQKRTEAEQLNAYLKHTLAQQLRVSKALGSALQHDENGGHVSAQSCTTTPQILLLILSAFRAWQHVETPSMYEKNVPWSDQDQQLFTQLYHYLEALYCNTSFVMDKLESSSSESNLSISSHSRMDPALGLTLEFSANTPVMCEFSTFEKLLWSRILASCITHECRNFEDPAKVRNYQY